MCAIPYKKITEIQMPMIFVFQSKCLLFVVNNDALVAILISSYDIESYHIIRMVNVVIHPLLFNFKINKLFSYLIGEFIHTIF